MRHQKPAFLCMAACAVMLSACSRDESSGAPSAPDSKAVVKSGYYSFDDRGPQSVRFEDRDGSAIFEGDIMLGTTEELMRHPNERKSTQGIYWTGALWNNQGILVYDTTQMPAVWTSSWKQAIKLIARVSRVRFSRDKTLYQWGAPPYYHDYVKVIGTDDDRIGGSSYVGRRSAGQELKLNPDSASSPMVAAHELMHALGSWHEQSRVDRDNHVTVNYANIDPSMSFNFDKHISDGITTGQYDYCSTMHYGRNAFSINGYDTITPRNAFSCPVTTPSGGTTTVSWLGQSAGISQGDAAALNTMYATAPAGRPFVYAGDNTTLAVRSAYPVSMSVPVSLNGSESFAVNGATIVKYEWRPYGWVSSCTVPHLSGPACPSWTPNPVSGNHQATASVVINLGPYDQSVTRLYELTVTDNLGRKMSDVVTIKVNRSFGS